MTDVFTVTKDQEAIHLELLNWASWVRVRPVYQQHPMWRKSRSNAWQWHAPVIRDQVDPVKAQAMEKRIAKMPRKHADALRWWYVWQFPEIKARAWFGETKAGLVRLIGNARAMCGNAGKHVELADFYAR